MDQVLSVNKLTKYYVDGSKKLPVLKDITFDVRRGEFFVLLGPSGSGKSTLLRAMSGLDQNFEGQVIWDQDIKPSDISFVFQQFALLPWLTVFENVELGILAQEKSPNLRRQKVLEELKRFGLERFMAAYPRELSGGMKQRVGIARAFVRHPKVIFMDEAFSELDSFTARELRQEFLQIWKNSGETVVMVTHLIDEAVELADRIAVLTPRPAKIERIVENKLTRPRPARTPAFWKMEDELYSLVKP